MLLRVSPYVFLGIPMRPIFRNSILEGPVKGNESADMLPLEAFILYKKMLLCISQWLGTEDSS